MSSSSGTRKSALNTLLGDIRNCTICQPGLPLGCNPVLRASASAKILIAGQAPGIRVHKSGIPFDDPSGDRLRKWMGIDTDTFYDTTRVAIVPMGFCYPGSADRGDLPPRAECAATWHGKLLPMLNGVSLTLVIGNYAQRYYLGSNRKRTLGETVKHWRDYQPEFLPLPHPSPRNNIWLKRNPWFEQDVIPVLQERVKQLLGESLV